MATFFEHRLSTAAGAKGEHQQDAHPITFGPTPEGGFHIHANIATNNGEGFPAGVGSVGFYLDDRELERLYQAARSYLYPTVVWKDHPEFVDWFTADHRGHRLVVNDDFWQVFLIDDDGHPGLSVGGDNAAGLEAAKAAAVAWAEQAAPPAKLLSLEDACRICGGDRRCDGTRHERPAEGDEDNRGGAPRP